MLYLIVLFIFFITTVFSNTISLNLCQIDYNDYVSVLDSVDRRYDMIVVGSGFSGASVAYHYNQMFPHRKILVIEKGDKPVFGLNFIMFIFFF